MYVINSNPVKQTLDVLNARFRVQMNQLIELHAEQTQEILNAYADRGVNIND